MQAFSPSLLPTTGVLSQGDFCWSLAVQPNPAVLLNTAISVQDTALVTFKALQAKDKTSFLKYLPASSRYSKPYSTDLIHPNPTSLSVSCPWPWAHSLIPAFWSGTYYLHFVSPHLIPVIQPTCVLLLFWVSWITSRRKIQLQVWWLTNTWNTLSSLLLKEKIQRCLSQSSSLEISIEMLSY